MQGYIHSIETMGLVDGPGIRTVVFLQGCHLRCQYCHNPDTWKTGSDIDRASKKVAVENGARNSGAKIKRMTPDQLIEKLKRFQSYYRRSGGGVTFFRRRASAATRVSARSPKSVQTRGNPYLY